MNNVTTRILYMMNIVLIFSSISAYANFGETCTSLPRSDGSGYLESSTAYGYVRNHLAMNSFVSDACDVSNTEFKFCIRTAPGSAEPCTEVSLNEDQEVSLGSLTSNSSITNFEAISSIKVKAEIIDTKFCLTMPTSRGIMPLICRSTTIDPATTTVSGLCGPSGGACTGPGRSQSLINFSGRAVDCLQETIGRVFFTGGSEGCQDDPRFRSDRFTPLASFAEFQSYLRVAIGAALLLYVVFFGFKIILDREYISLNNISLFVIKFVLVFYFSIGFGQTTIQNGIEVRANGVTEVGLPIAISAASSFADFVFSAAGSPGLCSFDRNRYESGYEFYHLWDALDCRIGYYMGMQVMYNIGSTINSLTSTTGTSSGSDLDLPSPTDEDVINKMSDLSHGAMFFSVMGGFFLGGQVILVIVGLVVGIVFISTMIYFFSVFLVCMVTLYVMAYISPIFVPMALFKTTKGYFDSWLRIVISSILQPTVIAGFIAVLVTLYDSSFYGNCEYQRHDYNLGGRNFSTFELRLPDANPEECINSVGYKFVYHFLGNGWQSKTFIIFKYFIVNDALDIGKSLIALMFYVVVFYFILKRVSDFAYGLVGGPRVGGVTVSPTGAIDRAIAGVAAGVALAKAAVKAKTGDSKGAAKDANEAKDKAKEAASDDDDKDSNSGGNNIQSKDIAGDAPKPGAGGGGSGSSAASGGSGGGK